MMPSFPEVLALLLDRPSRPEVDAFLDSVSLWRGESLEWIHRKGRVEGLSDHLVAILEWSLGVWPADRCEVTAYALPPFPEKGPESQSSSRRPLDILVWRSGVIDFLSDAWDVVDPGALSPQECALAEKLFMPASAFVRSICRECLQVRVDASKAGGELHRQECVVLRNRDQIDRGSL